VKRKCAIPKMYFKDSKGGIAGLQEENKEKAKQSTKSKRARKMIQDFKQTLKRN
jgi:hypothetical protein